MKEFHIPNQENPISNFSHFNEVCLGLYNKRNAFGLFNSCLCCLAARIQYSSYLVFCNLV
jgi:hypothetical protein